MGCPHVGFRLKHPTTGEPVVKIRSGSYVKYLRILLLRHGQNRIFCGVRLMQNTARNFTPSMMNRVYAYE
jgi:hypothetical protein